MLQSQQVEDLVCLVAGMHRDSIIRALATMHTSFPLDLSPQFLQTTDLDRLRHIFLAICLQAKHIPEIRDAESVTATSTAA